MKLKRKFIAIIVTGILCLVALGGFLTLMQASLSVGDQREDIEQKLQQMDELLEASAKTAEQTRATFDGIYQSKAESLAYMVRGLEAGDLSIKEYNAVLNTTNALILDRSGGVLAQAKPTLADFTRARYNQLRTVFQAGVPSEAFEVETDGVRMRYYGARIDAGRMAVIEQEPSELDRLMADTSTWKSILGNVSVGLNGYTFAVSSKDYTFLYHPDELLVGADALNAGVSVEDLEDGRYTWLTINGERLYGGVTRAGDAYILCVVPESELTESRAITVGIVLFVFIAVIAVVILYAILMLRSGAAIPGGDARGYADAGALRYNKTVGRKIGVISIIGVLCIFLISFYIQTLFSLSRWSMSASQRMADVERAMERYERDVELLTNRYNRSYLSKCETAAYILQSRPELANRDDLAELSAALDAEFICVFDAEGTLTATDSGYTNFRISADPADQSYAFAKLLQGVDSVIQEARPDDISGEYRQYVGVTLRAEDGGCAGVVQIAVKPEQLQQAVQNLDIGYILSGIKAGTNGFAFSVNKESLTFDSFPQEKYVGRSAADYGMTENEFTDGFSDYITLGSERYYGSSLETRDEYVYVVVPAQELGGRRLAVSLASAGVSLICLGAIFCIITLSRRGGKHRPGRREAAENDQMIDVVMPDGTVKKTESAAARWDNAGIKWHNQTPEQQVSSVLRGILGLLALMICAAVLFKDAIFSSHSVFLYVLSGVWQRGVNVFAITACVLVLCVVSVAAMLVQRVLKLLSQVMEAHGETICRLIGSFVKYVSVIAALYYCLALFGVDTQTLLASASILTLVIGLGANKLVADVIAGLFIIFEGDFRVGDIVTIGDWRGTVLEIGVRTTKLEDANSNIKILNNSAISGVINMTRKYSVASVDVALEYGEPLDKLENMLKAELPGLRRALPAIKDGPVYDGIVALGGGKMSIRIVAHCSEADRTQLLRDLNREIKLLFDRNGIKIL